MSTTSTTGSPDAGRVDLRGAVVVGVGNPFRGDDGAGPRLVARLRELCPDLPAIDAGGAPEEHAERILGMGVARAVLVDAAPMGLPPGSVRSLPAARLGDTAVSTHRIPPGLFVALLARLGGIGTVIVGIEPGSVEPGESLSPAVAEAVERLAAQAATERAFDAPPRFPEDAV